MYNGKVIHIHHDLKKTFLRGMTNNLLPATIFNIIILLILFCVCESSLVIEL